MLFGGRHEELYFDFEVSICFAPLVNLYLTFTTKMSQRSHGETGGGQRLFVPTHKPMNSMDLARQYEMDMHNITKYLFKEVDAQGYKLESFVSYVRIIEDSRSPSSRPPANSPLSNKKNRFLILSAKASGRMRLHKAKESSSGVIQIGRSWDFDELTTLELDDGSPTGFVCEMGKRYYWEVHTPKERRVWCTTLLQNFINYTKGKIPRLVNCSIQYFHLEALYDSYRGQGSSMYTGSGNIPASPLSNQNAMSSPVKTSVKSSLRSPLRSPIKSPIKSPTKSHTNIQRSPIKSSSPEVSSLKQRLATPPLSNSPYSPLGNTRTNLGTAVAGNANNAFGLGVGISPVSKSSEVSSDHQDAEREAKKIAEINKRRQQEIEKRKREELERRRREQEEFEKNEREQNELRIAEEIEERKQKEEQKRLQEMEKEREVQMIKQEELEIERQKQQRIDEEKRLKEMEIAKKKAQKQHHQQELLRNEIKPPGFAGIAKRGPPSEALSNAPSQMSFEYGDESQYHHQNVSTESANTIGVDSFIEGYGSSGDAEEETAPLNIGIAQVKQNKDNKMVPSNLSKPVITETIEESDSDRSLKIATDSDIEKLIKNVDGSPMDKKKVIDTEQLHENRIRAFSRVKENATNKLDLLEVLEELGYDPLFDDSESLEKKILKKLDEIQYSKIKTLTDVTSATNALKETISTAFKSCDVIDPVLSLFSVELSTFKDDVHYIEEQGQGLQVEATNEKLLMNEVNDLIHSVEISDSKLQKLLTSKIVLSENNSEFEDILLELYNALKKMNDASSDDPMSANYQLSQMKALQEKKNVFEGSKNKFVSNFTRISEKLFKSVSMSLTTRLQQVTPETFETNFLQTSFMEKSSLLITISGFIAFVKSVSNDGYDSIVNSFVVAFEPFFENMATILLQHLTSVASSKLEEPFSFTLNPSQLIDQEYINSRAKKDSAKTLFNRNNKLSTEASTISSNVETFFSQLVNIMSIEQELIRVLFGFSSSSDCLFENLVKVKLSQRCQKFRNTSNFLKAPIESDRRVGDEIYELMKGIFDPVFGAVLKVIFSLSKNHMLEIPAILSILKTYSQSLAPTCHEYAYGNFTKFEARINTIWTKEIDQQIQNIVHTKVHCKVANFVKAYPVFYRRVNNFIDSLNLVNMTSFGPDEGWYGNYYMVWAIIKAALNKGVEQLQIEIPVFEGIENDEIDIETLTQKHLALLLNYKWLVEETRSLNGFPKELNKSIDDLRDKELREFTGSFIRQFRIGGVIRLVEGMESVLSEHSNPANMNSYSIETIKELMSSFKGDNFKQEISSIAEHLKETLKGRCYNESDPTEDSEYSVAIGKQIEKELYNNCMYTISQHFISIFTRLSNIVEKHYINFEVPVDKYIINFNFKKYYSV